AKDPLGRSPEELDRIAKALSERAPALADRARELRATALSERRTRQSIPRVMVLADRSEKRPTYVLETGLYDRHAAEVEAGVPRALPPLPPGAPVNRLGLARWLVSEEHPLTARVAVNRIWQEIFGVGLVKTAEDFGT